MLFFQIILFKRKNNLEKKILFLSSHADCLRIRILGVPISLNMFLKKAIILLVIEDEVINFDLSNQWIDWKITCVLLIIKSFNMAKTLRATGCKIWNETVFSLRFYEPLDFQVLGLMAYQLTGRYHYLKCSEIWHLTSCE